LVKFGEEKNIGRPNTDHSHLGTLYDILPAATPARCLSRYLQQCKAIVYSIILHCLSFIRSHAGIQGLLMASVGGFTNFRAKVLVSFVAVYLISWLSILGATYFNLQDQQTAAQENIRQRFLQLYQQELNSYRNAFTASLEFITHPSRIAHSFTLNNKPFFLSNFATDYANLNHGLSVSHFYFSTAARRNIVRMHAPERSGDIINRHTMITAQNTGDVSSGIELGALGSLTFRVVKPIYDGNTRRGFVELGRELDDIWAIAARQLNVSIQVFVNKPLLDHDGWVEGKGIFGYAGQWNSYEDFVEIGGETSGKNIPQILKTALANHKTDPVGEIEFEGETFLYNTIPLIDVSGARIGTILIAYPQNILAGDLIKDLQGAASASAVALLIGMVICYILLSPVAHSMQNRQLELEKQITLRTHDLLVAKEDALEARDSAEIANKAKSEFLSNMSHELRTPLNAIIGFSSIVKNDELSEGIGEKYASYLNDIHNSGTHLLDIINDILDVSRIEAGEMEMRFQHLSISKLMHECHRMVNVRATDRFVPVIHDSYGTNITIDADATRLKQIILNLLSNAIKFTDPPGIVRFYAKKISESEIKIVVEDEGIGIPASDLPIVLRRFGKAASSALAKRREEGTGLGLTLVQDLVKQHGGTFLFESEFGKGTRVTVTLPIVQEDSENHFTI
jgi:signal transduction histidine kinase